MDTSSRNGSVNQQPQTNHEQWITPRQGRDIQDSGEGAYTALRYNEIGGS